MRRKQRLLGALTMVASIILLVGCNNKEEDSNAAAEEREIPVKVATVTFGALTDSDQLSGTILPENEVDIIPKASAEITAIFVEKGDVVQKGDILAQLDDTAEQNAVKQQRIGLEQAQASLQSAQNSKERVQNSLKQAELSLKSAQTSLNQARQSQLDNLKNLDIQLDNAQTSWDQANKSLTRMKSLYDSGLISLQDYEGAVNAEKSAKNALEQLKLSKEQAERKDNLSAQEAAVDQAQISLDNAKSSVKDADVSVSNAQIAVDQAQLALQSAMDRLEDKVIKATISGEVTDVTGKVGAMAASSSPFATVVSKEAVKLTVNVSANQLPSFIAGDQVDVKVTGVEGTFSGLVTYVSSISSGYGLFEVDIEIDNNEKIHPGMVASVIIEEIKQDNSLIIPTESIIQKEGKPVVFIVSNGKSVQTDVEVIQHSAEFTAVSGKLKEKDKVVISGQNLLKDGNKVQIMEEE